MANVFFVDPDKDILTNLLAFVGDFAVQNICARFSPFVAAQDFLETGDFDYNDMLSYEDITWDTVFAKMKPVQFANSASETGGRISDMSFYMDYTDMIHNIDSDALVKQFGKMSLEVSGYVCLAIWDNLKSQILPLITEETDLKTILNELKTHVAPIIIDSIKKYYSGDLTGIDDELKILYEQTQDVFSKIGHDETAFFKAIYASLVKGTEVMICNPEYLQLGDRLKSAVKYYTSGVSIVVGDKLSSQFNISDFPLIEKYAPQVIEFIPTLVSMIVTCAIVINVDKNPLLISLTNEFNKIPTITGNIALYRDSAAKFEQMAAELAKINLNELKEIIEGYDYLVKNMLSISDPKELNQMLLAYYKENNKELPWGDRSLEEHWADKNSRLVFK